MVPCTSGDDPGRRAKTLDAAVALIKSRLRRYVYEHCDPVRVPHRDHMLRFEESVETESYPAWKRALTEWGPSPLSSDSLRATIVRARDEAILLIGPSVSTQFDGASQLIDAFRQDFKVESLFEN